MDPKLRVILVDDQELLRGSLRRMLEGRGFEVVAEAADGIEGVRVARGHDFDVILTDLRLPNMDGIALAREVRLLDPTAAVVVFSAYADPSLQVEGREAGVAAWVPKGCPINDLIETLLAVTAKKAKR